VDRATDDDDVRLRQLIAEAKQRREEQRVAELRGFQQQLEETLSQDLCALLKLSYKLDKAGEHPSAAFTLGGWTWAIRRPNGSMNGSMNPKGTSPKWVASLTSSAWNREPIGFNTEDDLLLLIDALPPRP
jgi:hypothetical protein